MSPEEYAKLISLGLIDGDFEELLTVRRTSDFHNLVYAVNQLALAGSLDFGIKTKDWRDVVGHRKDDYRFDCWLTAPGGLASGKPSFRCNTITDFRGFIVGLLASHSFRAQNQTQ